MKKILFSFLTVLSLFSTVINAQQPCNGILQDSAWQQCWANQSAIVFEWWTTPNPSCNVVKIHYGNEQGYHVTIPGLWPSSNGYNNFAAPAGNG